MKTIFFILLCLISIKSFSNEIDDSYNQALAIVKSEALNPPTASYIMSEASSVAYKTYKKTLDKKAYQVSFLTLLKLYVPSKTQQLDAVINSLKVNSKVKQVSIDNALKRYNAKKDKFNEVVSNSEAPKGSWIPTFPAYLKPLLPKFGTLNTNLEYHYDHLFSSLPKKIDITSKEFLKEVDYVSKIGSKNSSARTTDQTNIALFWAAGKGTITPPGMWTSYALNESKNMKSFYLQAYTMKTISNALMDSAIICWNLKYRYNLLRPITAVRNSVDSNWESLLVTPNFPSFTSGHSTFSGSASIILDTVFNPKHISLDSDGFSSRQFKNYSQAAEEAGMSRIYGGIHYPMDNVHGLDVGRKIGCSYLKERFNFKCSK